MRELTKHPAKWLRIAPPRWAEQPACAALRPPCSLALAVSSPARAIRWQSPHDETIPGMRRSHARGLERPSNATF
jgi:hypothetical protein